MDSVLGKLKEAFSKPPTPENMRAAGQAMQEYVLSRPHNSSPMLVTLGGRSVPLDQIPKAIAADTGLFNFVKKIVERA